MSLNNISRLVYWCLSSCEYHHGLCLPTKNNDRKCTHMMNSDFWQTAEATPPVMYHGLSTVWPPLQLVPASAHKSTKTRTIYTRINEDFNQSITDIDFITKPATFHNASCCQETDSLYMYCKQQSWRRSLIPIPSPPLE